MAALGIGKSKNFVFCFALCSHLLNSGQAEVRRRFGKNCKQVCFFAHLALTLQHKSIFERILDKDPLPTPSLTVNLSILLQRVIEFHAPDSWLSWALIVGVALLCLCMSAFVSGSEIAFFGLTPQDIEELEENQDDDNHSKAFNLISQSERLLATILISNNLVNVTLVILLSFAISQTVVFNSPVVDFLLQTVFLTFLLLLFGEIFPKLVAKGRKKKWALFAAGPLTVVYNIVGPLAKLMARSTTLVNRVITKRADSISTDELSQALEISDVKSEQDKEMLEGILSFGEKEVSEIMVSRIDVTDIDWNSSWSEVVETILQSGFSRIPVYDKTQDNIKGVLYSKDLIPYIGKRDDSFKWQNLLRPAFFIPESKMIDDLLEDFRRKKTHIAIVVDEYGCTQGIVTLEDILEEIVGDIDDEYDEEDKLYQQLSEDTYVFEAKISLSDFCRVTGVEEEEFGEIGEVETLAGLILSLKGDFPTKNESVVGGRCRFLVLEIRRHRIISVRVKVMSEIQSDASNPED